MRYVQIKDKKSKVWYKSYNIRYNSNLWDKKSQLWDKIVKILDKSEV